ncbi:MAG: hypothetical protein AMXMBFR77_09750 [Phycisphaerales bacterium]|nr:MAG: hypothetical protein BroJett004_03500 [Planctomycetota bacterium]
MALGLAMQYAPRRTGESARRVSMSGSDLHLPQMRGMGKTSRTDAWWLQPGAVLLGLTAFIVYTTWAALQGQHYFYDGDGAHYLSPFYSPLLFGQENEPRVFAATHPSWWPGWLPFSPAMLILIGPAGMRFTCYYYRGAYYKAFWGDPPACAVGEPGFRGKRYRGERRFPLVMQNAHRYFFYPAAIFVVILAFDAFKALWFTTADGMGSEFGVGVGTIMLALNAILLGGYTFGCHCARHLVGGRRDTLSDAPIRRSCYTCVSWLNRKHMAWAWVSLIWVALTDVYVRLLCTGVITDFRII